MFCKCKPGLHLAGGGFWVDRRVAALLDELVLHIIGLEKWWMRNLFVAALLVFVVGAVDAKVTGVTHGGAEIVADDAGGRKSLISAEHVQEIERAYGAELVIVEIEVDNRSGSGEYAHYWGESRCTVSGGSDLTPVDRLKITVDAKVPAEVRRMFYSPTVAKGEVKTFAVAYPYPGKGSKKVKSLLLRTALTSEWVSCH